MRISTLQIYIDLGTANTRIFVPSRGLLVNEPTMLLVKNSIASNKGKIIASGKKAKELLGKTAPNYTIIRPLEKGVISNSDFTEKMLNLFLKKHSNLIPRKFYRLLISLPYCVTEFERNAVRELGNSLGFGNVLVINELIAGMIGENVNVCEAIPNMIVDLGDGIIEVAIISCGKVVSAHSARIGGQYLHRKIIDFIKNKYNFLIGDQTAEYLKINGLKRNTHAKDNPIRIKGRDLSSGIPRAININGGEVQNAIETFTETVIDLIRMVLRDASEEIASDIIDQGIILTGGGAFIHNISNKIFESLNLKVKTASEPLLSTVKGGKFLLQNPKILEAILDN